jgi:hypothetical protein
MDMIDSDIHRLLARDSSDLTGLEADIWRREAERRGNGAVARRLASWQAAVLALAVISSASVGSLTAMHGVAFASRTILFPAERLAPSSLLFGERP